MRIGIKKFYVKDLNFEIKRGELVAIIGPNGSGKTRVLERIIGRYDNKDIFVDDKNIDELPILYKKKNIVSVFNDLTFNTNSPLDELKYFLLKLDYIDDEIDSRVEDFIEYFKLEKIVNCDFDSLSVEDKVFIKLLSYLIVKPRLFCIDDLMTYLSYEKNVSIFNYIKEKKIMLVSVISNTEELKFYDKVLVMNKGYAVLYDKVNNVISNEELFNELGLEIPFIYDINNMLKSYELINEDHLIEKDLVSVLWK